MKKLYLLLAAIAAHAVATAATITLTGEPIYIGADENDTPPPRPAVAKTKTMLKSDVVERAISTVGFVNTGVTTNIDGVAYRQFAGYTQANFDASSWDIYYIGGSGWDSSAYTVLPHDPTVNVSPLTYGSSTYKYCYKSIFYIAATNKSFYCVAQATLYDEEDDKYKSNGREFTRLGAMPMKTFVLTDFDLENTDFYKQNTATELVATGKVSSITSISMNTVTPIKEEGSTGYVIGENTNFSNVNIQGSVNGEQVVTYTVLTGAINAVSSSSSGASATAVETLLKYNADGTAIAVTVPSTGTLSADTTDWVDGQAQTAIITLATGATINSALKLVGYGSWPRDTTFAATCLRTGDYIYVIPIAEVAQ